MTPFKFKSITSIDKNLLILYDNNTHPPHGGGYTEVNMVANDKKVMTLLKTAKGQLESVINMVENDRYCMDISTQILAVQGLLSTVNKEIITAHLKQCVNNAETETDRNNKIDELVGFMGKIIK